MTDGQLLEFSRATKRFGALTAVDDLSAQIAPGAVTGFLGPNGAGKTTSLRMLLGLVRPTSGTATIGGTPYAELRHPLRSVGSVMEEPLYRPRRTAVRQLTIAAKANGIPLSRVDEVVSLVGLQNEAETRIGAYSLGMRQRLSIATALLGDPGALVLDEPANGLDPEGIRWMRLLMRRLADEGRTVLVSSHVLSEIEQIADNVLVLARGRLVYADSISKLSDPTNGSVIVDAEDRDALVAALTQAGLAYDVLRIGLSVHDTDAATVGALAATAGIALRTLQQRGPTLEEVFLDLVHGRRDPVAGEPSDATRAMPTVTAEAAAPSGTGASAAGATPSGADATGAGAVVAGAAVAGAAAAGAAGLFGGSDGTGELSPRRAARAQAEAARRPEAAPDEDEPAEAAAADDIAAVAPDAEGADLGAAFGAEAATDDAQPAEAAADRTDTGAEAQDETAAEEDASPAPSATAASLPAESGEEEDATPSPADDRAADEDTTADTADREDAVAAGAEGAPSEDRISAEDGHTPAEDGHASAEDDTVPSEADDAAPTADAPYGESTIAGQATDDTAAVTGDTDTDTGDTDAEHRQGADAAESAGAEQRAGDASAADEETDAAHRQGADAADVAADGESAPTEDVPGGTTGEGSVSEETPGEDGAVEAHGAEESSDEGSVGEAPGVALTAPIATDEDFGLHLGSTSEDGRPDDESRPGTAPTSLFATPAPAASEEDGTDVLPFATEAVSLPPADVAPSFDDLVWGPAAAEPTDDAPETPRVGHDAEAAPAETADATARIETIQDTASQAETAQAETTESETAAEDHTEPATAEPATPEPVPADDAEGEPAEGGEAQDGRGQESVHVFEPDPATAVFEIPSPDLIAGQGDAPSEPSTETTEIAGIEIFASLTEGQTQEIQVILEHPHEDDHGDDEVTQGEDPRAAAVSASLAAAARAYYSDDAPAYTPSDSPFTRSEAAPAAAAHADAETGEPGHVTGGAIPERTATPAGEEDADDASSGESRSDESRSDEAQADRHDDHGTPHHEGDRRG